MKKLIALFILAGAVSFGFSACNSKDDNSKVRSERLKDGEEDENDSKVSSRNEDEDSGSDGDIKKAAVAACECMSGVTDQLSSRTKNMVIKAANSNNPQQTLQREMMEIDDVEEQREIQEEVQKVAAVDSDPDVRECNQRVDRKYKIASNDKATQRKIISALEDEGGCEVLAAFMKITLKSGAMD